MGSAGHAGTAQGLGSATTTRERVPQEVHSVRRVSNPASLIAVLCSLRLLACGALLLERVSFGLGLLSLRVSNGGSVLGLDSILRIIPQQTDD